MVSAGSSGPASYELVASTDSTDDLRQQARLPRQRHSPLLRHLALAAAFVFLAVASYSLGEWKGRTSALGDKLGSLITPSTAYEAAEEAPTAPTVTPGKSDTEETMDGKYSVG